MDDALTTSPSTRLVIPVLANATDPQNLALRVVAIGTPTNGTATFNLNGTFTNRGALTIDSTRTMVLDGNTDVFNQNEGTIAGKGILDLRNAATMNFNRGATTGAAPILTNAKLNFGPAATGVAAFIMQGQDTTSQLSGDIGAEQTVWIRGNGQPGNAMITALNGFTNAGVIRLESQVGAYQSNLAIANGALTNTGTIDVQRGNRRESRYFRYNRNWWNRRK